MRRLVPVLVAAVVSIGVPTAAAAQVPVDVPVSASPATVRPAGGSVSAAEGEPERPMHVEDLALLDAPTPPPAAQQRLAAPSEDSPDGAEPGEAQEDAGTDLVTAELDTVPFSVLGITWDVDVPDVTVSYRVRSTGVWTDWSTADADVAPDADRQESATDDARTGTDPIVALDSDGLQVRASSPAGTVTGLKAVLVDPGNLAQDATLRAAAVSVPGTPVIYSRAEWGADESMRTCEPDYSARMSSAAVHHTASTNSYSPADVPGLLRGFLAYHTRPEAAGGRGWCDIGYNFLVDKFGRIFEGRAGGVTTTVVGVHTGGFNSQTIGISVIGDYSSTAVSGAVMDSLTALIAWKFALHGIRAGSSVTMVSGGGASKFPAGTVVTFPTIYGHRDAQLTSCPGQVLYDLLPELRARVAAAADAAVDVSPRGGIEMMTSSSSSITVGGWAVDPEQVSPLTVQILRNGAAVGSTTTTVARPDIAALYPGLGGQHGFTVTIAAPFGTSVVCVRVLNVGQGTDVVLGCLPVTVRNAAPIGAIDAAGVSGGTLSVSGWALDPDTNDPTAVHVYVDGVGVALLADLSRPDVAAVHGRGDRHGFTYTTQVGAGLHDLCVYAIDTAGGPATGLVCRSVGSGYGGTEAPPVGAVDMVAATNTTLAVAGWAFDPNYSGSTDVHIYIDGVGRALRADGWRPDVARAFSRDGAVGFGMTVPASPGAHQVCAYAIDKGPSAPTLLGCFVAVVTDAPPFGGVEQVQADPSGITVSGWTVDPDTTASTDVHVYIDGVGTGIGANLVRPDIAAAFGRGDKHGFAARFAAAPGQHQVCIFAINTAPGPNTGLGCYTTDVRNAPPFGGVEQVQADPSGITVSGWTVDPDTTASTDVHVYIDGVGTGIGANLVRPDIAAAFGRGDKHGFAARFAAAPGQHQVCIFAINTAPGPNTGLGCYTTDVRNAPPFGGVEQVQADPSGITVSGWTVDPDTTASTDVHVYIDGVGTGIGANLVRPDIAAAFGRGDKHGFAARFAAAPGQHQVCIFAINTVPGPNTGLGCYTAAV